MQHLDSAEVRTILSQVRDRKGPINDLKFSADGRLLAVASGEDAVDFYSNPLPLTRSAPRPRRTSYTSSIGGSGYVHLCALRCVPGPSRAAASSPIRGGTGPVRRVHPCMALQTGVGVERQCPD